MVRLGETAGITTGFGVNSFNSTMVRLGGYTTRTDYTAIEFQFHYGPIGSRVAPADPVINPCFNSTMVRLGVYGAVFIIGNNVFQFHYGPIGSLLRNKELILNFSVSIPLWSDWETERTFLLYHKTKFQFHYGPIGSRKTSVRQTRSPGFNSTMVRLGAVCLFWVNIYFVFQFHYGPIGRFLAT